MPAPRKPNLNLFSVAPCTRPLLPVRKRLQPSKPGQSLCSFEVRFATHSQEALQSKREVLDPSSRSAALAPGLPVDRGQRPLLNMPPRSFRSVSPKGRRAVRHPQTRRTYPARPAVCQRPLRQTTKASMRHHDSVPQANHTPGFRTGLPVAASVRELTPALGINAP